MTHLIAYVAGALTAFVACAVWAYRAMDPHEDRQRILRRLEDL
jgi:putative flippase GtrA